MGAGATRTSSTGISRTWWLLVTAAGAVLLSVPLLVCVGDRPARAEQAQEATASLPTENTSQAISPPTASVLPTMIPTPTMAATVSPPTAVPVDPSPAPPSLAAGDARVSVHTGPGADYATIGALEPGGHAEIYGRHDDWWQIGYEGGKGWVAGWLVTAANVDDVPGVEPPPASPTETAPMPTLIPPPAARGEIDEERWIDVDLSEQSLTAYERQTPVRTTLVSTGLPATPTPPGQFRIWVKYRYDDMEGPGYYLRDVPFVMYFYKGYGLHGATWHANFGHPMSHGCVNLPVEESEWLFNWADVGTLVNVHE
jgi:lipoprotein-anchoring transpeptidase ErfK/SrfK